MSSIFEYVMVTVLNIQQSYLVIASKRVAVFILDIFNSLLSLSLLLALAIITYK